MSTEVFNRGIKTYRVIVRYKLRLVFLLKHIEYKYDLLPCHIPNDHKGTININFHLEIFDVFEMSVFECPPTRAELQIMLANRRESTRDNVLLARNVNK